MVLLLALNAVFRHANVMDFIPNTDKCDCVFLANVLNGA